jgi:putative ABC transport system permease protein
MKTRALHPPKWPLRFLRFFLKEEYLEEIEGDLEEIFFEHAERFHVRKAKRLYTWEIIKLLRPSLIKNLEFISHLNQFSMFRNYFKVSLRGLMKNPVNSFINIIGLSFSIGICVFAYAFARWTISTDQFHVNKNEVFLITFAANRDGAEQLYGHTPRPLGEMLKEDFSQVKKMCRVEDRSVVVKFQDDVFHERVRYTDPDFLEMFTFPLKWGTASSLKDINSIILSENMSLKYFGDENPIGQSIRVIFSKDISKEFKITGVAKEFPKALTIRFDFLINFENFRTSEPDYNFQDWGAFVNATFIQVSQPPDVQLLNQGMQKYRALQNKAVKEDWAISAFSLEPLATLHERSEYIRDDISRSSKDNYLSIMFLVGISVFLLALASFNYINIAIVTATRRLKEIGIRKCIGATRKTVSVQFLTENIVITFFALILGIILAITFFIPGFERLWSFNMDFNLLNPNLWIYLPLLLLLTSIVSGIYPALYISKFQVVNILKGSLMFGKRNPLTKTLLGFQLIMACIFITTSIMFTQNTNYLNHRGWGYNQHDALYAKVPDGAAYEKLNTLMAQYPDVVSISGSKDHVGKSHSTTVLHFPDREFEVDELAVDARYFSTLEIPLEQGRWFKDHEGSDRQAVVVNELLVNNMNWANPVGQQFRMDSMQYEVIGVVSDFHNYSFSRHVRPVIFTRAANEDFRYLTLKVRPGTEIEAYKTLQANWAKLYPEIPFDGSLQEDVWGFYYEQIKIYGIVWKVFAFIAVMLATLGLYGMVRLNVEGRTKEFSIRKVMGAGLKNITTSVTNPYAILFATTVAIGSPLGYAFGKWIIEFTYPYHMPITFSGITLAVTIVILVLSATVFTQIVKVLKANPVEGLKAE